MVTGIASGTAAERYLTLRPAERDLPARSGGPLARLAGGASRFVARDQALYREGDPATHLLRIRAGCVRISKATRDGRRQVLAFAYPGDIVGLDASDLHLTTAETVVACEVERLDRGRCEQMAAIDPTVALALNDFASATIRALGTQLLLVARGSAVERLVRFILDMAARQDDTRIELPMGRSDIADYLGLTCETLSRTLGSLKRDGLIAIPETQVVVIRDLAALEDLV